jgi:hydrogenase 3 maturation protease
MNWQNAVKEFIAGKNRIVVLGIGNVQKGDDAAGALCADALIKKHCKNIPANIKIINCGEVPENYTGDIRRFKPSHVLIIDAVIAGHEPGTIFIVDQRMIENTDVSTHRMSLSMLYRFLEESIGCQVLMIGIEPDNVNLDTAISEKAKNAIDTIVQFI